MDGDTAVEGGFYTLSEAARVLGVAQRCLLEMLEAGEVEGERDPQTSRWKISKHALHKLSSEPPPVDKPSEDLYEVMRTHLPRRSVSL